MAGQPVPTCCCPMRTCISVSYRRNRQFYRAPRQAASSPVCLWTLISTLTAVRRTAYSAVLRLKSLLDGATQASVLAFGGHDNSRVSVKIAPSRLKPPFTSWRRRVLHHHRHPPPDSQEKSVQITREYPYKAIDKSESPLPFLIFFAFLRLHLRINP